MLIIRDENAKTLVISSRLTLNVQLGTCSERVKFYVAEKLTTTMTLGCDFADKDVEGIRPRTRTVRFVYGTTVPIVHKRTSQKSDKLSKVHDYTPRNGRPSNKITVNNPVTL